MRDMISNDKNNTRLTSPSPWKVKPFGGLDATSLRLLALGLMLLDHMWATIVPGNMWMTYVGRLTFPIFAFQVTEGFFHSSDRKQYMKRLLLFGLMAEVPFDFMMVSAPIFIFHQNVMFTLALGLWMIGSLERLRTERTLKQGCKTAVVLVLASVLSVVGFVDYGIMGVWTVVIFYLCRGVSWAWMGQLVAMVLLNIVWFKGESLVFMLAGREIWFPTQGFAVLSLLLIWLYNGQKGSYGKSMQRFSYWFYPVHMMLLHMIRIGWM